MGKNPAYREKRFFLTSLIFNIFGLMYVLIIPFYVERGIEYSILQFNKKMPLIAANYLGPLGIALFLIIAAIFLQIANIKGLKQDQPKKIGNMLIPFYLIAIFICVIGAIRLKGSPGLMFGAMCLGVSFIGTLLGIKALNNRLNPKPVSIPISNSMANQIPQNMNANQTSSSITFGSASQYHTSPTAVVQMPPTQVPQNSLQQVSEAAPSNSQTIMPSAEESKTTMPQKEISKTALKQKRCPECGEYASEYLLERIEKGFDGYCERCGALIHGNNPKIE